MLRRQHLEERSAQGHYFHQDLLVAQLSTRPSRSPRRRRIQESTASWRTLPSSGRSMSSTYGRSRALHPVSVSCTRTDGRLPDTLVECCDSLSCLHALEHFGLGRYGDPSTTTATFEDSRTWRACCAAEEALPVGAYRPAAHRVQRPSRLLGSARPRGHQPWFALDRFSYVDDRGDLHDDVPMTAADIERSFGCRYGCGIFEMTRTASHIPEIA